jgi:hypothetical protein
MDRGTPSLGLSWLVGPMRRVLGQSAIGLQFWPTAGWALGPTIYFRVPETVGSDSCPNECHGDARNEGSNPDKDRGNRCEKQTAASRLQGRRRCAFNFPPLNAGNSNA